MLEEFLLNKEFLLLALFIINLVSYKTFAIDKKKAIRKKKRISEKMLLFLSLFFGGFGAYIGMKIHRHKNKKLKFRLVLPFGALISILAFIFILID